MALRALESVVLAAENNHRVVAVHIDQHHLGATRHTTHRTHSLANSNRLTMRCHMHH